MDPRELSLPQQQEQQFVQSKDVCTELPIWDSQGFVGHSQQGPEYRDNALDLFDVRILRGAVGHQN